MAQRVRQIGRDDPRAPLPSNYEEAVQEILRLRSLVGELRLQVASLQRSAKRQAAPHSRNERKADPRRPGRKPGQAYGTKARRQVPEHVDERIDVPLPERCPFCGGRITETGVHAHHEVELPPPPKPYVTRYDLHVGCCQDCGRRVQPRHARQSSDALGAAGVAIGPRAAGTAAWLNKALGIPHGKVAQILNELAGLQLTGGGVVSVLHRATRAAEPTYRSLVGAMPQAPVVTPDETGWRVGGASAWMWIFATPTFSVFRIAPGRGFDVAAGVLGADYAGILVRDGWAVYRRFTNASHQTCLSHLIRRANDLLDFAQAGQARIPHAVLGLLHAALKLREDRAAGLSVRRYRRRLQALEDQADALVDRRAVYYPPNVRLLDHLERERQALFTFLHDPRADATNFRAEQGLRPGICSRHHWGGNVSWAGAHTQEVLVSVLRTAVQQQRHPVGVVASLMNDQAKDVSVLPGLTGPDPP